MIVLESDTARLILMKIHIQQWEVKVIQVYNTMNMTTNETGEIFLNIKKSIQFGEFLTNNFSL